MLNFMRHFPVAVRVDRQAVYRIHHSTHTWQPLMHLSFIHDHRHIEEASWFVDWAPDARFLCGGCLRLKLELSGHNDSRGGFQIHRFRFVETGSLAVAKCQICW